MEKPRVQGNLEKQSCDSSPRPSPLANRKSTKTVTNCLRPPPFEAHAQMESARARSDTRWAIPNAAWLPPPGSFSDPWYHPGVQMKMSSNSASFPRPDAHIVYRPEPANDQAPSAC